MSRLMGWIKSASGRLLDPRREDRIKEAAVIVERRLAELRDGFQLRACTQDLNIFVDDLKLVVEAVYRSMVRRAWRDGEISERERKSLQFISKHLELNEAEALLIERAAGREAFVAVLTAALADGEMTAAEVGQLEKIAGNLKSSVGQLMRTYFENEASGVLRTLFLEVIQDGSVNQHEWDRLLRAVEALGLAQTDLLEAIRIPAEQFIEHVLAEAKNDGELSPREASNLSWLLQNTIGHTRFSIYVNGELARLRLITSTRRGHLPWLPSRHLGLRSGELVHLECDAVYLLTKNLKSGPTTVRHAGKLVVTDSRMMFASSSLGLEINHRKILSMIPAKRGFELQTASKGNGYWHIDHDAELATLIYQVAVQRANQTVVASDDNADRRRIPRDVRQRVWQRDGARCVDCGATMYLEFDHVIPVAKGGGNVDNNVQLLCRGCNGKKSDMI